MKTLGNQLDICFLQKPIAHRGLHDFDGKFGKNFSENTISSFKRAINFGFSIEIDVRMTIDKEIIVYHDRNLKRLIGLDQNVDKTELSFIKNCKLPNGEEIPTLDEVLRNVSGTVPILIEVKDLDGYLKKTDGFFEKKLVKKMKSYFGKFAIMSSNPYIIKTIIDLNSNISCGLVTGHFNKKNWPLISESYRKKLLDFYYVEELNVSFISNNISTLNNDLKKNMKKKEIEILSWTVKSFQEEKIALKYSSNITFEGFFPKEKKNDFL